MILAINTGNQDNSIAIFSSSISYEVIWESYKTQSQELLPKIDKLLRLNKVKFSNLKAIAVYQGPGSYTGLRVGIAVANLLAWSLNIPVIGIKNPNIKLKNKLANKIVNKLTAISIAQQAHKMLGRKKILKFNKIVEPFYQNNL